MKTQVRRHVEDFLLPVDVRGGVVRIAEEIVATAERNLQARRAVITLAGRRPIQLIDPDSQRLYQRVVRRRSPPTSWEDSAETTLLAVTHVRAAEELRGHRVGPSFLARVPHGLQAGVVMVEDLEPDFVGELLVETELRATRDVHFAATLDAAAQDLRWLQPQVAPMAGELAGIVAEHAHETGQTDDEAAQALRAARTIDEQVGAALILTAYVVGIAIGKTIASA
jgi:hypothetical protein